MRTLPNNTFRHDQSTDVRDELGVVIGEPETHQSHTEKHSKR